jgi:prephenate dehydratase/prephenate dehydrogenase
VSALSEPHRTPPQHLVVIGAASGMGRWLCEHVLRSVEWSSAVLIDTAESIIRAEHGFDAPTTLLHDGTGTGVGNQLGSLANTAVVVAVPLQGISTVASWLAPLVERSTIVVDTSHHRGRAVAAWGSVPTIGLHPLFGVTAASSAGQTFALCDARLGSAWLHDAIEQVGGTVNVMTDEHHDAVMEVVQRAAHESLLSFLDVVGRSGLDLDNDLWANRTPVFELLLALAVRVLQPGQDATTVSIQQAATVSSQPLVDAVQRLETARLNGDDVLADHLVALREPFSGGLFAKIAQTGALATAAAQASRARIADYRRADEIVGVRTIGGAGAGAGSEKLSVGRIVANTPTSFTLENLLVGTPGNAALLLDRARIANARRAGIGGKPRRVEYRIGRVEVLSPAELEAALDSWLVTVTRGCKVLIPEQISGSSAAHVIAGVPGVIDAEIVTEEVRIGQRECVVRFTARIDRDIDQLERHIQSRIDATFLWPEGTVLPVRGDVQRIGFLGPAGTFSDIAARQLARISGHPTAARLEFPGFGELISALQHDAVDLVVLPITSSSSGLVDLAAAALATAQADITAGGMIDVPIRFDAYMSPTAAAHGDIADGQTVFSHPQGIRQCSQFIEAHRLQAEACSSTVVACRRVSETGEGVALAATGMDEEFGLVTVRSSVGNLAGALTRFLVLGRAGRFGEPVRSDALSRSIWLIEPEVAGRLPVTSNPRYDEVLRGPSGRTLLVSTDPGRVPAGTEHARFVATIPWSPRTPLVIVE